MAFITRRKREASELELPDGQPIFKKKLANGKVIQMTGCLPGQGAGEETDQTATSMPGEQTGKNAAEFPAPVVNGSLAPRLETADTHDPNRHDTNQASNSAAEPAPDRPIANASTKRAASEPDLSIDEPLPKKICTSECTSNLAHEGKPPITKQRFHPPGGPTRFAKQFRQHMLLQVPRRTTCRSHTRQFSGSKVTDQDYVDFALEQDKQHKELGSDYEDGPDTHGADLQTPDYFFEKFYTPCSPWSPVSTNPIKLPQIIITPPSPYLSPSQNVNHEDYDVRAPKGRFMWVDFRQKTILSFPRHVRKKIYSYALFPKGIEGCEPSPYFSQISIWRVKPPALLQCAADIREEALPIYYEHFRVGCRSPVHVKMWLSSIGPAARKALGALTVSSVDSARTEEEQIERAWTKLKNAGVAVPKAIIKIY